MIVAQSDYIFAVSTYVNILVSARILATDIYVADYAYINNGGLANS
ncbi:hypothetical protein GMES_1445 [Paraglaciecola mesophila KMM 241]|uniref:Uncharacterized protein n=1 Tax=Paraglaciecola mesophila KMM 241 TaxID=1128912 RepID=K6XSZ7_9ALTE|nr:hypothetical protein GMES_1445 [Paraglaciecola mesophila KMM 241]